MLGLHGGGSTGAVRGGGLGRVVQGPGRWEEGRVGAWRGRAVGWGGGDGRRVAGRPQLWCRSGPA